MAKKNTTTRFRSAEDGKFLTEKKAKKLPKGEVVKEQVPKPGYGDTN